jgi:hypothetical protein
MGEEAARVGISGAGGIDHSGRQGLLALDLTLMQYERALGAVFDDYVAGVRSELGCGHVEVAGFRDDFSFVSVEKEDVASSDPTEKFGDSIFADECT